MKQELHMLHARHSKKYITVILPSLLECSAGNWCIWGQPIDTLFLVAYVPFLVFNLFTNVQDYLDNFTADQLWWLLVHAWLVSYLRSLIGGWGALEQKSIILSLLLHRARGKGARCWCTLCCYQERHCLYNLVNQKTQQERLESKNDESTPSNFL